MFNKLSSRQKITKATSIFTNALTLLKESTEELESEQVKTLFEIKELENLHKETEGLLVKNAKIIAKISDIIE